MEFFDAVTPTGGARPPRGRPGKSEYEVPASAPGDAVIVRTDEAAVWIGAVRAYSNGFEFTLRAVRKDPSAGSPLVVRRFPPADPSIGADHDGVVRVGVQYADGRRAAISRWSRRPPQVPGAQVEDPAAIRLTESHGGGDSLTWDAEFWVSPLPPDGPVLFYAAWPDAGAGEQRAEFDGTAIRAAGARAVRLPAPADEGPAYGSGAPGPPGDAAASGGLGIPGPRPPAD